MNQIEEDSRISFMRSGMFIVAGTVTGDLQFRDPRSLKIEHRLSAHVGGIADMDASGNILWSVGHSLKQGQLVPDPLVKAFDIRNMKAVATIPFPHGPAFVRGHPSQSTTCYVSSQTGEIQILDVSDDSQTQFFQTSAPYVTTMAVSDNGYCMAVGDQSAILHLWSNTEAPSFNSYMNPPEMPSPLGRPDVHIDDDTPLSVVGMPAYTSQLLSASFNPNTTYTVGRPPQRVDQDILASMKVVDFVGYATNPRRTKRYQVDSSSVNGSSRMDAPKFRSEKDRERKWKNSDLPSPSTFDDPSDLVGFVRKTAPNYYRKIEIKYSRFGIEDFDFGFYNKTHFGGLETHIANSYCNALLQVLHFTPPIRRIAKSHIAAVNCTKEYCLCCELGFLFRMLEDANGQNCQASNFLRAFSTIPQAAALGLYDNDEDDSSVSYTLLIQTFNRFVLEQINAEANLNSKNAWVVPPFQTEGPPPSSVAQVLSCHINAKATCTVCGTQSERTSSPNVQDIIYPRTSPDATNPSIPFIRQPTFVDVLSTTLVRIPETTRAWCASCKAYQIIRTERDLHAPLPPILAFNAAIRTPEQLKIWAPKEVKRDVYEQFLHDSFTVELSEDGSIGKAISLDGTNGVRYELIGFVAQIEAEKEKPHLVSYIRAPHEDQVQDTSAWYLFNDFLVKSVSQEEVLAIASWKVPSVLYFQRVDADEILDYRVLPSKIDKSILTKNMSISRHRDKSRLTFEPLTTAELPTPGMLVAIDAEFVAMQQEEIEIRSDGTRSVLRPSRLNLARVSVVRGDGPRSAVPFIDDYIATTEPVFDYLTEFSGIKPGDLDPSASRHTLVPLKVAYKKLRLLVDLGCVFVGHGLKKDFRIINILVPPEQVIDTVDIYRINQRMLSLRFLSWIVLGEEIQIETHDSIEDARMALFIYKRYLDYEAEGRFDQVLKDIYAEGREVNFKPPSAEAREPSASLHQQVLLNSGRLAGIGKEVKRPETPPWEVGSNRSSPRGSPRPRNRK